jgi:hypothetical protein
MNSMAKQSKAQKETVGRVMHEFKHGELGSSRGGKVKNPKQAVAIALREAGSSKYESKSENERNLRRTKRRERKGETEQARAEGKPKARRSTAAKRKSATARKAKSTKARRAKSAKPKSAAARRPRTAGKAASGKRATRRRS